jgi:hypothetical protein
VGERIISLHRGAGQESIRGEAFWAGGYGKKTNVGSVEADGKRYKTGGGE